jgi:hypothetical protein
MSDNINDLSVEPEKDPLSDEQFARSAAITIARDLLKQSGGLGTDPADLIRVAGWILTGKDETDPLYPLVTGDIVRLGPDVEVHLDTGIVTWRGVTYYPATEVS